ncbi:MAG: hypothetical protein AB1634_07880 [Thermodesulfobacteriota bacterium]
MSEPLRRAGTVLLLIIILAGSGCATHGERVAPVPLPAARTEHVNLDGVRLLARAYLEPEAAAAAFGFTVREAGLLPVQVVIDNQGPGATVVDPAQTFLVDAQGQAWPLLSSTQAYERAKRHVEIGETAKGTLKPAVLLGAAGALAGFAVGIVTGENAGEAAGKGAVIGAAAGALAGGGASYASHGEKVRHDLANRALENRAVQKGDLAHGFLFFPGTAQEAVSVLELRLAVQISGERRVAILPLASREP